MEQKSIRSLCDEKIELFRSIDNLDPMVIAKELIELSSLWASIQKELIDRRMWYAEKKKFMLIEHGKAALATIHSEASPEYRSYLEAEAYSKSIQEMIRVGKKYIAINESIRRESVY